jgi:MFS family permease
MICSSGFLRSQSVLGFERLGLDLRDRLSLGFTAIPDKDIRNSTDSFGLSSASLRGGISLYRNRQPITGAFQIRGLSATADFSLVRPSLSFLSQDHTFYTARLGVVTHFQIFKIPLSFNIGAGAADDGKFSAPKLRLSGHLLGSSDVSSTVKLLYGLSYSYNFTRGQLLPILGVIALMLGGLLGGYAIYRKGLKFWIWIMVCAMHLPNLVFVFLSQAMTDNFHLINLCVAVEQFGYGFGFTAYTMFMIMVSEGEHKTVHYAISTGIMALGMMVPAMFSGWLQEQLGYQNFFLWIMAATIPGFIVTGLVKIDPKFGKKKP